MEIIKYERVYVAFLDILGFKELVQSNNHDVLTDIYSTHISESIEACRDFLRKQIYNYEYEKENVHFLSVSDSIILWTTDDDDATSLVNLLVAVRSLCCTCMLKGVPLRGGIGDGRLTVINNTNQINIVGEAITNAYNTEQDQDWSGCVISETCINNIDPEFIKVLVEIDFINEWTIPKKTGPVTTGYAVNWLPENIKVFDNLDTQLLEVLFSAHNKRIDNWSVRRKIENTFQFIRHIVTNREAPK